MDEEFDIKNIDDSKLSEQALIKNAYIIKQRYLEKARAGGSSNYTGGKRLDKAVAEAARICTAINADPCHYVEAQYWAYRDAGFQTGHLHSYKAVANYREFCKKVEVVTNSTADQAFETQKRYLGTALKNSNREVEAILMDGAINFTPWFRVLITKEPVPAIMTKYKQEAKLQVQASPSVQKIIKEAGLDIGRLN